MAWIEDPSTFLGMDAKPVTAGAVSGEGYLDQNSEMILGGEITVIDLLLTVPTATFGSLSYGDLVTVDGASYKCETQPQRFDNGSFCRVPLVKVSADQVPVLILDAESAAFVFAIIYG
jgi:hypothetical protein